MKVTVHDLFDQYEEVKRSYCGDGTNWQEALDRLEKIYTELFKIRFSSSKNYRFYDWQRQKLYEDVAYEIRRVREIISRKVREDD